MSGLGATTPHQRDPVTICMTMYHVHGRMAMTCKKTGFVFTVTPSPRLTDRSWLTPAHRGQGDEESM
jgi:hypothetical protein